MRVVKVEVSKYVQENNQIMFIFFIEVTILNTYSPTFKKNTYSPVHLVMENM
jgi:hypothetical protein